VVFTNINKLDLLIVLLLLASSVISFRFLAGAPSGETAYIEYQGRNYSRLLLKTKGLITDTIQTEKGSIVIARNNGSISILEAPCPDKVCVNTGKINRNGEKIICVPNKLVISIGSGESEYDATVE
jgi:hypothetical protein